MGPGRTYCASGSGSGSGGTSPSKTMSGITSAVYGAEALLPALADVNRARIGPNPSHLPAGVVLQLPEPAVLVEALAEHHNRTFGDFPGWSVPAATVLATAGESP